MLLQDICQRRSTRFWKSSSCKFKFNRTRWFGKRILRKGKDTLFHKDNSCLRNAQRTNVIISFLLDASASVHFHMWLCFLLDNASRKFNINWKVFYCTFWIPAQIFIFNLMFISISRNFFQLWWSNTQNIRNTWYNGANNDNGYKVFDTVMRMCST